MLSTILEWQQESQELLKKSPQNRIILFSVTLNTWSTIIILTLNPLLFYYIIILHIIECPTIRLANAFLICQFSVYIFVYPFSHLFHPAAPVSFPFCRFLPSSPPISIPHTPSTRIMPLPFLHFQIVSQKLMTDGKRRLPEKLAKFAAIQRKNWMSSFTKSRAETGQHCL